MNVNIYPDYDDLCIETASYIAKRINSYNPTKENPFVLGLPTGSSPIGVYNELAALCREGEISFKNVVTFNMDEYIGLPAGHPQSYRYFMETYLFKYVDIPAENINFLNGTAIDLQQECIDYENRIQELGGIELFMGGIGVNAHIAFNEPGSGRDSKTRVIDLAEETIVANSRFFEGELDKVPTKALSVGIKTIMDAKEVILIVNGQNKATALQKIIEEAVNESWPGSILQLHKQGRIVCDLDATQNLKQETVEKYTM